MIEIAQKEYALTKLTHTKLKVIEFVISNYLLSFNSHENTTEIASKISILIDFYHRTLKRKIDKRFPSETYKVKFQYHEAIVIVEAFILYQTENFGVDTQQHNLAIIDKLKTNLHRQIV